MRWRAPRPRRGPGRLGGIALLTLCLISPHAQGATAEALFKEAERKFGLAQFQRSLILLERAEAEAEDPRLKARIHRLSGLNHAVLGQISRARMDFRAALLDDPTLTLKSGSVKPSIIALFEEVRRDMQGTLLVESDLDGASVLIDGEKRGPTPLTTQLSVGRHRVEVVSEDGQRSHRQQVVIRDSSQQQVVATLSLVHAAGTGGGQTPVAAAQDKAPSSPKRTLWIEGWVVGGVGAGSLIASAVLGGLVSAKSDEHLTAVEEQRPYGELLQIQEAGEALEAGHTATLIAGSVLLATGVGLLIWSAAIDPPAGGAPPDRLSVAPLVLQHGGGLWGRLRF